MKYTKTLIRKTQDEQHLFGQKCKQRIIEILSKQPDKELELDEDCENAWALVSDGTENPRVVEVRIVKLSLNELGELVLESEDGDAYNQSEVCYTAMVWPDILLVAMQNLNLD